MLAFLVVALIIFGSTAATLIWFRFVDSKKPLWVNALWVFLSLGIIVSILFLVMWAVFRAQGPYNYWKIAKNDDKCAVVEQHHVSGRSDTTIFFKIVCK